MVPSGVLSIDEWIQLNSYQHKQKHSDILSERTAEHSNTEKEEQRKTQVSMTEGMQNGRQFRCMKYLKMRRRREKAPNKMDKSNNQE